MCTLTSCARHPRALPGVNHLGLAATTARSKFRVDAHPLGLKPGFHGMSLNQLYDQIEAEDSLRKGRREGEASLRVAEDPES